MEKRTAVETTSLDEVVTTVPSEVLRRFHKLADTIQQQRSGGKVYKVGDEERDVDIVGKTPDDPFGEVSGIHREARRDAHIDDHQGGRRLAVIRHRCLGPQHVRGGSQIARARVC
jgi:hypothetical protein